MVLWLDKKRVAWMVVYSDKLMAEMMGPPMGDCWAA